MKDDVNDEVSNGTSETLIPSNGMLNLDEVSNLVISLEGTCYTFLRLDRKTYFTKFNFKMFICR
jgi:hypothetical protein